MKRGLRSRDDYFTVYVLRNAIQHSRLGITVSRRVARLAVVRNRLKRHIRECFRLSQRNLPPVDVVVLANPAAASADVAVLRGSLARHLSRLLSQCATCH